MMSDRDQIVPLSIETFKQALIDPTQLHCVDCGGWPLDNGAAFVAVFIIKDKQAQLGGICEVCWLQRLHRRAAIVNATSGPSWQIKVPGL